MSESKKEIRRRMLTMRRKLMPSEAFDLSWLAQEKVMGLDAWQKAGEIVLYMNFRNEVLTDVLMGDALSQGKEVLLPRCRPDTPGVMDLVRVPHAGAVVTGKFGIPEPDPELCKQENASSPDLIVVPGVAFDRRGLRLGYGGGYYDRLLGGKDKARFAKSLLVGLCYDFQLVEFLPREEWDTAVAVVVTQEDVLWTST